MATQKMTLPSADTARAELDRTIQNIFNEDYQIQAFDPDPASGGAAWGGITGTVSDQLDLQAVLDGKVSLTDYTNITVVDSNGKGDFTTLSDAIAANTTGNMIVIMGSQSGGTISLSSGTFNILIPNYSSSVAVPLSISGANVTIFGVGRMSSTITISSGSLTFINARHTSTLTLNGGTVYGYNANLYSVDLLATMPLRFIGGFIGTLSMSADFGTGGSGSYITNAFVQSAQGTTPRTNVPIFNCTMRDEPFNITVAAGNYSNVVTGSPFNGSTWPAIP